MKLLIITQKVDINDPILGFFHRWIIEFAKHCEQIIVICLEKGEYDLPSNVKVLSLGKENGPSRLKYIWRFYKYIWQERKNYDKVFVHMNQEYILLAGWWWRFLGKEIFMWYNHHSGSWLTELTVVFCNKVFCTSKYAFTARFKKTVLMPVGVDTRLFKKDFSINKIPQSILFLGRISPVKRPHLLIEVLNLLKENGVIFEANFYGDALPKDQNYFNKLKKIVIDKNLSGQINFYPGVPNRDTVAIYNRHKIFVNLSSSGMYDKTIFEAMACGCLILVSNDNLRGRISDDFIFQDGDRGELFKKLNNLLCDNISDKENKEIYLNELLQENSLEVLGDNLFISIK